MITKFEHATIITMKNKDDVILNGTLVVRNHLIEYVGAQIENDFNVYDQVIDCKGNILLPGFVNAHSNLETTCLKGMFEGVDAEQLRITGLPNAMKDLQKVNMQNGVLLGMQEMLQNGITTTFDVSGDAGIVTNIATKTGLRTGIAFGAINGTEVLNEQNLQKNIENIQKNSNFLPFLFAHSTYLCDEMQFATLIKVAKHNKLPLVVRLSETLQEVGTCHSKNGVTPIGLLESFGVLDTKCVLLHATHADKEDIALVQQLGEHIAFCHLPSVDLKLGNGVAPVFSMLKHNCLVALGTGSAVANNELNLLKEMNLAALLQKGVLNNAGATEAWEVLQFATINGARAFGLNDLGQLKQGFLADVVMLDAQNPNNNPVNNLFANVVFGANAGNVLLTMVDGVIRYKK